MYLTRTASSYVCRACRKVAAPSSSSRSGPHGATLRACVPSSSIARRAFGTSASRRAESTAPELQQHPPTHGHISTEAAPEAASQVVPSAAPIPWYLREHSSIPSQTQQAAQLPPLPPNPPPLLQTLVEYVSVTAGLDDVQLLDLRHLDPPPALGPKLVMMIATARSEKHLHVAADRFCRYLRREHGLRANAAGLLGRNELKIKLRRKAKRMRMLANVGGAAPEGNIDDGIRTGWICCTLGKLEAHPDDTHMPGDNVQEFVGFRDVKSGVNVVVQMFTEEKRAETDLETLWGGVLRTNQRKDKSADEALKELEQDFEDLEDHVDQSHHQDRQPARTLRFEPHVDPHKHPDAPAPAQQMRRPQRAAGDFFPPASTSVTRKQLR